MTRPKLRPVAEGEEDPGVGPYPVTVPQAAVVPTTTSTTTTNPRWVLETREETEVALGLPLLMVTPPVEVVAREATVEMGPPRVREPEDSESHRISLVQRSFTVVVVAVVCTETVAMPPTTLRPDQGHMEGATAGK